jgi:hypothetical protein
VVGPKNLVVKIGDKVKEFLTKEFELKLDEEKSKITHPATEKGKFLGTLIGARSKKYTENLLL